jgi:hypothetical protein
MLIWWCLSLGTGAVALVQLLLLNQRRRLLVNAPVRRRAFVQQLRKAQVAPTRAVTPLKPKPIEPSPPAAAPVTLVTAPQAPPAQQGIVYVDAAGHCTLADRGAREILHWNSGERMLSDVFAGGSQESAALLSELARQGSFDRHPTALAGAAPAPLEVSGVALRDRDDNLWGAALFIHRRSAAETVSR